MHGASTRIGARPQAILHPHGNRGADLIETIRLERLSSDVCEKGVQPDTRLFVPPHHTDQMGRMRSSRPGVGGPGDRAWAEQRWTRPASAGQMRVHSAAALDEMINSSGDATVNMEEFKEFFNMLEVNLTEGQVDQLFAFCDLDCSGQISEQEFVNGYDKLVEAFLENAADAQGVSLAQIVLFVATLLTLLTLLIVFVLITLSAWNNESNFTAIVQGGLISGVGKASTALRRRSKAEEKNVDSMVSEVMKDGADTAAEAGAE